MNRRKLYIPLSLVFILIILLIYLFFHFSQKPKPGGAVSSDIIAIAQKYLSAEEDSVGADQSTPNSWLNQVRSITTSSWFSQIQPATTSTSSVSAQYYIAHNKKYVVKTELSNCIWVSAPTRAAPDSGTVFCSLSDKTIDQQTGAEISGSSLPFGWTYSGPQAQHNLYFLKQNGHWLINNDVVSG
jgi:hypothetical protein